MEIIIKRKTDKKNIISYKRVEGDDFWIEADDFLVLHDLSHFSVETNLHYNTAFWGLLKKGLHPSVFENKLLRDQLELSDEAWHAEHLANLFLIELSQGQFENINQVLKESIMQHNPSLSVPELTEDQISNIRATYRLLAATFKKLSHNESIQLKF